MIANEVADALPVHRFVVRDGQVREVRVGLDSDDFVDVLTLSRTAVSEGAPLLAVLK